MSNKQLILVGGFEDGKIILRIDQKGE